MALPKRRKSHSRVRTRQAQWKAKTITLSTCAHCGQPQLPHHACGKCGYYNGRQVLAIRDRNVQRPDAE